MTEGTMDTSVAGKTEVPAPEPRYRPPAKRLALGTPIAGFKGQREVRTLRTIEFRAVDEVKRQALIRVCVYNEVDDYGTVWVPGCWQAGLEAKMPKGTWSHDWTDIIGRAIDYEDTDTELRLLCQFSDFAAVPRALQAWTQLRDGDVDEFSFGFERRRFEIVEAEAATDGERERMIEAVMHEWSPVLVGAVPGTGTVSVRSPDPPVLDSEWVARLAVEMAAGKLSLLDALEAVREAAGGTPLESVLPAPAEPESDEEPPEDVQPTAAELDAQEALMAALDADVAEALELAGRSGRRPRETRGPIATHDTAVNNDAWDGPAATAAMPNDAATLAYCHAWRDPEGDPEAKGSYKMPHHRTKGGPAIGGAIRNGLARLPQSNIPAGDKGGVEKHLRAHLDKLNQ